MRSVARAHTPSAPLPFSGLHRLPATDTLPIQSNTQRSALSTERQTSSLGATLACEAGREVITYSANFLRKDIENVVANLSDATTSQAFKSWEVFWTWA